MREVRGRLEVIGHSYEVRGERYYLSQGLDRVLVGFGIEERELRKSVCEDTGEDFQRA